MAKLVAVVRNGEFNYSNRQMPLVVEDDKLTMVLQFPDSCVNCGIGTVRKTDLDRFVNKYMSLDSTERLAATTINQTTITEQLACLIPCVGCRRSVERMLDHLALSGHATLDPMNVSMKGKRCQITLTKSYREDPKLLFAMFYIYGEKLQDFVDMIPRSKKNKRCQLHSLDIQKTKSTSNWVDLWELLSEECREEILRIDYQKFMEAMIVYLEKHRFCIECKTKVLHAHGLLIGDEGKKKDKSYCPALYDGIKYCKNAKHVHIKNNVEFIASLITRAEPDLMGSRRERHAKTLDIAQEEVLTCLGSYLYVRFNRLLQKIKLEEQTWQQLSYIGICCLRQNFEVALEKKQGISQLELLCTEIELEERNKELKKEMKRKKKKKSKQIKQQKHKEGSPDVIGCVTCSITDISCTTRQSSEQSQCSPTHSGGSSVPSSCDPSPPDADCGQGMDTDGCYSCLSLSSITEDRPGHHPSSLSVSNTTVVTGSGLCGCDEDQHSDAESEASPSPVHRGNPSTRMFSCAVKTSTSDLGYSSDPEGCDSCSASTNSNEGASSLIDTVVESYCDRSHTVSGDTSLDHSCDGVSCDCSLVGSNLNSSNNGHEKMSCNRRKQTQFHSLLQDMLEPEEEMDDCDSQISEADIAAFKANMSQTNRQRLQLREKLKQRFDDHLQKKRTCCHFVDTCSCDK